MSGVPPATTATVGGVLLDTAAGLATPTGSALTIGLFATQDPGGITHRFDVRNYGARCDGITDDSVAYAAAIAACNAANQHPSASTNQILDYVFFPAGRTVIGPAAGTLPRALPAHHLRDRDAGLHAALIAPRAPRRFFSIALSVRTC